MNLYQSTSLELDKFPEIVVFTDMLVAFETLLLSSVSLAAATDIVITNISKIIDITTVSIFFIDSFPFLSFFNTYDIIDNSNGDTN